jgi:iron complex outermembrane receptor protein
MRLSSRVFNVGRRGGKLRRPHRRGVGAILLAGSIQAVPAPAAEPPVEPSVEPEPLTIIITVPRLPRDLHRTSSAVAVVGEDDIQQARQGLQLDESLNRVPGLLFQNRYNFAQNLRMSIRGFGARAPFGIRGIRILVDGFPETLPDGQSQVDGVDLESAEQVEVIRGPSSALYGNAAGGVVQIRTAEPPFEPYAELRGSAGSHDFRRLGVRAGGREGPWGAQVSAWRLDYDGYREQSRTRKDMLNAKLRYDLDGTRSLTTVLTALDQPLGQDAGGLTRAEVSANRRQAAPGALALDAGQEVRQQRVGFVYRDADALSGEVSARVFYTRRDFHQQLPFAGPSLIEFARDFYGAGADYTGDAALGRRSLRYTVGVETARQGDDRQRFLVDGGGTVTGQTQDALETATAAGVYGQADLALTGHVDFTLGGRYDRVRFTIDDRYTPDAAASGSRDFDELSFTLGLGWQREPAHRVYINAGSSFETPTFTEFTDPTRPDQGFDPGLEPQQALNVELGAKGFAGARTRYDIAVFTVRTRDEIVQVATDPNRYVNAARTRRAGLEAGLEYFFTPALSAAGAYTWARYRFREFVDAAGEDLGGKRLPGLPQHALFAELAWRDPGGVYVILDTLMMSRVYADNANREPVAGYGVANLRIGKRWQLASMELDTFAALNNLTGKRYFSNVRVNAAGGRYFEPAPERNVHVGLRARF